MKILLVCLLLSSRAFPGNISRPNDLSYGVTPNWSSARKTQVGTSLNRLSHLWFTNVDGILSEVYYPTIDRAQIKDSQIIVSDGKSFFADEKNDVIHRSKVVHPSLLEMTNIHQKFQITHTYYPSSSKNILVDEITIVALEDNLHFYLLVNPALNNTGFFDSGSVSNNQMHFWEAGTNLFIKSSVNFKKSTIGFVGVNDGHLDLRNDFSLDSHEKNLKNGNVAGTAELDLPSTAGTYKFYVSYHFDNNEILSSKDFSVMKSEYIDGWEKYFSTLNQPSFTSEIQKLLYYRSLFTLKVHEDKKNPGALIASLSKPWGESLFEYPGVFTGGYHLVWPRDLYHVSLALLYSGDRDTAVSALGFLKRIQYKKGSWNFNNERIIEKKGAFPQNVWTNLQEYWGGLQLDQVGYPIHLFWQIYERSNSIEKMDLFRNYGEMVFDAAEFIYKYGPWSAQERWEENFGISPSTFSVAASALKIATKIFNVNKYDDLAHKWLYKKNDNIHSWTFTHNGEYGDGEYYLRVAGCSNFLATWNPNDRSFCTIANSGEQILMTKVLDQGFLKLSLLGLVPADDIRILKSLDTINDNIRVKFSNDYSGWYRYSFDAYGENKKGRIWPLLSGEHGRFAIERFNVKNLTWQEAQTYVDSLLDSFEFFANDGMMIPEQVFEKNGVGTGAATPLAWSHAEFIKLLWSKENKRNIENPL